MTLTEFLLARIAEDEAVAKNVTDADYSEGHWRWEHHGAMPYRSALLNDRGQVVLPPKNDDVYPSAAVAAHITSHDPARVLAECEAKRRIVALHEAWPVLVQQQPTFERVDSTDPSQLAFRASQQIAWLTEQEYRARFGTEPPTAPMLAAMAAIYADHPDYNPDWRP